MLKPNPVTHTNIFPHQNLDLEPKPTTKGEGSHSRALVGFGEAYHADGNEAVIRGSEYVAVSMGALGDNMWP